MAFTSSKVRVFQPTIQRMNGIAKFLIKRGVQSGPPAPVSSGGMPYGKEGHLSSTLETWG